MRPGQYEWRQRQVAVEAVNRFWIGDELVAGAVLIRGEDRIRRLHKFVRRARRMTWQDEWRRTGLDSADAG
jgi:hypothetical protein